MLCMCLACLILVVGILSATFPEVTRVSSFSPKFSMWLHQKQFLRRYQCSLKIRRWWMESTRVLSSTSERYTCTWLKTVIWCCDYLFVNYIYIYIYIWLSVDIWNGLLMSGNELNFDRFETVLVFYCETVRSAFVHVFFRLCPNVLWYQVIFKHKSVSWWIFDFFCSVKLPQKILFDK